MENTNTLLAGGLALLPILGVVAMVLIGIQFYKLRSMGKQFADCTVRKGIVRELGMREPTKTRPYRHCAVSCSFSGGSDVVEIPYDSGDLNHVQPGDELSVYFYPNGVATVVAYDEQTVWKKFKQYVLLILVLCVVMAFLIPAVGIMTMSRIPK